MASRAEVPELGPASQGVAWNMRRLRDRRGWTAHELAARCLAAGGSLPRSVIANIETGRRAVIGVDELAVLGAVFGVEPWSLTSEPVCLTCHNDAPVGFACLVCGQGRLKEPTDG